MQRREFITLFGGAVAAWRQAFITLIGVAATAWSVAAQRQRVRRLGALMSNSEDHPLAHARLIAFREALAELGWTEGRHLKTCSA
jgi:hypothetical protein